MPQRRTAVKLARKKVSYLRSRLLERRRQLLSGLTPDSLPSSEELPDVADMAAETLAQDISLTVAEARSDQLSQVECALERLGEGTYGQCEECGARIGAARLRAMPMACLCLQCQSTLEQERATEDDAANRDIFVLDGVEDTASSPAEKSVTVSKL